MTGHRRWETKVRKMGSGNAGHTGRVQRSERLSRSQLQLTEPHSLGNCWELVSRRLSSFSRCPPPNSAFTSSTPSTSLPPSSPSTSHRQLSHDSHHHPHLQGGTLHSQLLSSCRLHSQHIVKERCRPPKHFDIVAVLSSIRACATAVTRLLHLLAMCVMSR